MTPIEYDAENILLGFVRIEQSPRNGKYLVGLEPQMLGNALEPLPPGQVVTITEHAVKIGNELDYIDDKSERYKLIRSGEYRRLWAGRPVFRSYHYARETIISWIKENRPELWRSALTEAQAGAAYRAAQQARQRWKETNA